MFKWLVERITRRIDRAEYYAGVREENEELTICNATASLAIKARDAKIKYQYDGICLRDAELDVLHGIATDYDAQIADANTALHTQAEMFSNRARFAAMEVCDLLSTSRVSAAKVDRIRSLVRGLANI